MSQNWHTQRTAEIAAMQHRMYARTDSGHAFQLNEDVQLTGKLVNGDKLLPPFILGRVTAVTEHDVTVAFNEYGDATLSRAIAADYLQPYRAKGATDAMRAVFGKGPRAVAELKTGVRVKDGRGAEYVVESFDPFRRMAVVSDGQGHVVTKAAGELKVLAEDARQTVGSDGVQPGQKAMVTGIDPNLNQWRKYAVQQGEAGGIVGQTGTIVAAHYPTGAAGPGEGQGETMYTVLLPSGAKKSFSAKELRIVESEAASGLTEAREPVARRSLQPASAQRRPLVELTEDMLDALEESTTHTRQHYEMIGDILRKAKDEHGLPADDHATLVDAFGRMFRDDNPHYIHHRFASRASGADYTGPRSRNMARPTQRHFQAAADVIRSAHISQESRNRVIHTFADQFGMMSPRFKDHLFRKAAGSITLPEKVGDVSRLGESVGGVQQGAIVHQPKPVTDPAPKPVPAATAAVPKTTTPKLGAVVKTSKGKGVVMGEVDGKLQVALDDGGIVLIDESALLPAFGRPQWTPPEIPQEKDTPPLRLGDLINYNGIPGVVAEITAEGAHVMLDNGSEVVVEMTPTATGVSTMVKPTAKAPTPSNPVSTTSAPSASAVTTETRKEPDGDEDGEKKTSAETGHKEPDGDEDDDDEKDEKGEKEPGKDDKKVDEGVIGMGTMPSFKTSAPSSSRIAAEGAPVEGDRLIVDGKEAHILGFTRFDGRTLLPTEARVSIGGEEQLVALGEGVKVAVQERLNPISSGIRKTLQRLSKERPQPIVKEGTEPDIGHKPPAFMRSLVESVRTGKGLRGGSSRVASPETLALEATLNEHLAKS